MSALAGGILSFGELHGAVVTRAMRIVASAPLDGNLDDWADMVFEAERAAGRRVPGIGHRWHERDLRSERLLDVAHSFRRRQAGSRDAGPGGSRRWARRSTLSPVNVDGALAVALTALRLDPEYGDFLFAIARSFGLAAHIVEERARERPMRMIDPTAALYDGIPVPDPTREETNR